jgi:hypothetical protein
MKNATLEVKMTADIAFLQHTKSNQKSEKSVTNIESVGER